MPMMAIEVIFDPDVRKMDTIVEVRQLVFASPLLDLARIPIRPTVAVRAIAIALLQELLVLPFELTLHDDVPHVRAMLAELAGGMSIRVADARVVRQLAAVDAVAVAVAALVVAVTAGPPPGPPGPGGEHDPPPTPPPPAP